MKLIRSCIIAPVLLSACEVPPEQTPMQQHLNRVAGAEIVTRDCPAYGGYGSVAAMRADAAKNAEQARKLGATDADLESARQLVAQQYGGAVILVGPVRACHELINRLAWVGSNPA